MYLSPKAGRVRRITTSLLNFVVIYPFSLLVAIFLSIICAPLVPIVWILSKIFRPDLERFVEAEKSIFIQGESNNSPTNIVCLLVIDGIIKAESYRQHFQERVFSLKQPNGRLVYEGFQYFWVRFLGFTFWKKDAAFDLKNHVRDYDFQGVKLPSSPEDADLENVVGSIVIAPWKKDRSPWEILFIHNYKGENKTIKLLRFDHVLADGYSIIQFFRILTQSDWRTPNSQLSARKLSTSQRLTLGLKIIYDITFLARQLWGQTKLTFPKDYSRQEIIFSMSPAIPVDVIKSIRKHYNVSYGAVCYAAVTGAIARALDASGEKVPKEYVTNVILPRANHPGGLCIHLNGLVGKWPLRSVSPEMRLHKIDKTLKTLMNSSVLLFNTSQHKPIQLFPSTLTTPLYAVGGLFIPTSVGFSTMPVITGPDYYDGMKFGDLIFAVRPLLRAGIVVSMGGMDNKQRVTFTVNKTMFSSEAIAKSMGAFFEEEIQKLVNATT